MSTDFVEELQAFVSFLGSVWGVLGSVSVFFPLSTRFFVLVPLGPPPETPWLGLKMLAPDLVVAIATLSCVYAVFWSFGQRDRLARQSRRAVQRTARARFGLGLLALLGYLAVFYVVPTLMDESTLVQPTDPVLLLHDVGLAVLYAAFFVLVTRAFLLLGLTEYLELE